MRIISKPVAGINFKQWSDKDRKRWWQLVGKIKHTQKELSDIEILKTKYNLNKFYNFSDQ
jgi:hypothetical protein